MTSSLERVQLARGADLTCPRGDDHVVYPASKLSPSPIAIDEGEQRFQWSVPDEASGFCDQCKFPLFFYYHDLVGKSYESNSAPVVEETGVDSQVSEETSQSQFEEEPVFSFERTPERWKLALAALVLVFVGVLSFALFAVQLG